MEHAATRTVGVVIRTLDEAEMIGRCLETLKAQRPAFDLDILVVDSGSTDDTIAIARAHGARIHEIPPEEFDYSMSLNVGIERVRGDLVVLLSAHAIPLDDRWLAQMVAAFDDPQVAGVASRQVPWPGAPWWELRRLRLAFGADPVAYRPGAAKDIVFSNAASCIRRSVWEQERFELHAAEDLEWARRVVAAGWTVVYEAAPTVYHSHDETPREQALRMIDLNRVCPGARTRRRTLREAAGLMYRNAGSVLALDEPLRRRVRHLRDLTRMCWWYYVDFAATGSTAERRR
jgi:rhamnosyltransferase